MAVVPGQDWNGKARGGTSRLSDPEAGHLCPWLRSRVSPDTHTHVETMAKGFSAGQVVPWDTGSC